MQHSKQRLISPPSGSMMDKQVTKKRPLWLWLFYGVITISLLILSIYWFFIEPERVLGVDRKQVKISTVKSGTFEDFIPVRVRVIPLKTVLLDAVEGGRVEKKWVEDGATVSKGQVLLELSNTDLQLSVMRNESEVIQQLNNIRTIELQLEQNRLSHERNLVDIDYQIVRLSRLIKRYQKLIQQGGVSQQALEEAQDELSYMKRRKAVTIASRDSDQSLQQQQFDFLQHNGKRLENNLTFARENLEKLTITAPVAGKLSGFDAEVGQSIQRGGRIGQIDSPKQFKYSATIDEFYLNRIDIDQLSHFQRNGHDYTLKISKIYPQVENGQFRIDLLQQDLLQQEEHTIDVRRGQTLQTKLTLGDANPAYLFRMALSFKQQEDNGSLSSIPSHNRQQNVVYV